jgi:hypothetical protein
MQTKELDSFKLSDAVTFHDQLNPKLWVGNKLRPEVKTQLQLIADDFLEELGINDLDVIDTTVSGSNAAYSYTNHSDLDLHILVNLKDLPNNSVYKELFQAKKTLYNDSHDIKIHGVPVELYVQDASEPVISLGEYSIENDKWLKIPSKRRANFDQTSSKAKYSKLLEIINTALVSKDLRKVEKVLKKIKRYRQAGLDKGGEFGPENLAYKALRSQGYITKLYKLRDDLHSEFLTIENMYSTPVKIDELAQQFAEEFSKRLTTDEDYDPNGPPPGPEFKPTMPAGTVKVDVSDVYDWYKLGQHVSNLKGLGKHDFGKGPPSTILSFGDEDTEHKYIKDLEKTGLTTTDIDPVDINQPKGMKRQKVDPTYNVAEGDLQEIQRTKGDEEGLSTKGQNWGKETLAKIKMLPGSQRFGYTAGDAGRAASFLTGADTIIELFDVKHPQDGLRKAGFLSLRSAPWFPIKNSYQVANVALDREYRGQGLGQNLYGIAMKLLGMTIVADDTQTPQARSSWLRLSQVPGVTINGYTSVFPDEWALRNNRNEIYDDSAKRLISSLLKAGGQEIGKKSGFVYVSFPVGANADQNELQALQKGMSIYSSRHPEDGGTQNGLYARWGGQVNEQGVVEDDTLQYAAEKTPVINPYGGLKDRQYRGGISEASGYIPSEKEKNDPRFKMALTVDIGPYTMKKDAKKFGNKISRAGIPPTLNPSGKF